MYRTITAVYENLGHMFRITGMLLPYSVVSSGMRITRCCFVLGWRQVAKKSKMQVQVVSDNAERRVDAQAGYVGTVEYTWLRGPLLLKRDTRVNIAISHCCGSYLRGAGVGAHQCGVDLGRLGELQPQAVTNRPSRWGLPVGACGAHLLSHTSRISMRPPRGIDRPVSPCLRSFRQ